VGLTQLNDIKDTFPLCEQWGYAPTPRGAGMTTSKWIARIVGPTLIAVGVTEAINIDSFAGSTAPVVYLNGMVLFVAGLTIVQAHNRWVREWSVLVTLTGWVLFFGGLYRMFAPAAPQMSKGVATYGLLAVLVAIGGVLTYKAYGAEQSHLSPPPPRD
jgi:hypothetical protein